MKTSFLFYRFGVWEGRRRVSAVTRQREIVHHSNIILSFPNKKQFLLSHHLSSPPKISGVDYYSIDLSIFWSWSTHDPQLLLFFCLALITDPRKSYLGVLSVNQLLKICSKSESKGYFLVFFLFCFGSVSEKNYSTYSWLSFIKNNITGGLITIWGYTKMLIQV